VGEAVPVDAHVAGPVCLGLSTAVVVGHSVVQDHTPPALIDYRRKTGNARRALERTSLSSHPVLANTARSPVVWYRKELAAPHGLEYVTRLDLTAAGSIVDCYNIVSAKTLLSIGAHDLASQGPHCTPSPGRRDLFQPLEGGEWRSQRVNTDVSILTTRHLPHGSLQFISRRSFDLRDVVFFIQGNREIASSDLLAGAWLSELVERFLGGSAELVAFQEATNGKAA
jgi:hypothetical protein